MFIMWLRSICLRDFFSLAAIVLLSWSVICFRILASSLLHYWLIIPLLYKPRFVMSFGFIDPGVLDLNSLYLRTSFLGICYTKKLKKTLKSFIFLSVVPRVFPLYTFLLLENITYFYKFIPNLSPFICLVSSLSLAAEKCVFMLRISIS